MSRWLVSLCAVLFAAFALAPVAVTLLRIESSDLGTLLEPRIWSLLARTIGLGLSVAAGCLLLGVPFGFLVARTDVFGARFLRPLSIVPLLVPTLLMAMTWTALSDVRGPVATAVLLVFSYFPLVSIFTARAAERIDARQEESAWGLGGLVAVLRADVGAILPASLAGACLAFTFAVNDFSVPDFVSSVGVKFNVYADEIFANWSQFERPGLAVATALPLLVVTLLALVPVLVLRRRGALAPVTSSAIAPATLPLGRWRWPATLFAFAVVGASSLVPLGRLGWEASGGPSAWRPVAARAAIAGEEAPPAATAPRPVVPGSATTGTTTNSEREPDLTFGERLAAAPVVAGRQLDTFASAFGKAFERARDDVRRSLWLAIVAATAALALGLVLGHAAERSRFGTAILMAALVPIAVPGTLFGIGTATLWDGPWLAELTGGASTDFYATPSMAALLYIGRLSPFAILIVAGAVAGVPKVSEWAAASVGAGPVTRLLRIVAPAITGALAASWICVYAFAMRELDSALVVPEARRTAIVRVFNGVHFGRDEYVAALSLVLIFTILLPGMLWAAFSKRPAKVLP
ncbi:spermidine/putrescine ABC transporter membrane protein [Planctomycetes bacterium Pla163]|uniref:Spermidine/putrescine ABC transporter membrane protein n=1 Tax=Rohdeia mirabilis TaxID=2528008 RepID=A0A518D0X4_9BACT|nr:spermidine/putrescine ABC transporter membrane protein [Planctomycetes bacterium Pla163]